MPQQRRDVGRAGVPVHRHDGEQHQHRAEQRVEEELEACVDPPRSAPDADDQEHRDQAAFEEQVEHHEIERRERADHQRFQHQERDHVFLDALLDRQPARDDADRHQRRGQDHERQRDAVDPHVIVDRAVKPRPLLDELEFRRAGIEAPDHHQRNRERDQRRPQRHPARVAVLGFAVRAHHHDEQRARERQERRDGENGPAHHPARPSAEHEPGDERRDADHHGEGVVVEIAGLQSHHVARDAQHPLRHAVGPEAVDQPAVAVLPQEAAEPHRRPDEDDVIELVEVPLVEQEFVERRLLAREFDRQLRPLDIEPPGDGETDHHHHRRQHRHHERNVVHLFQDAVLFAELQRIAEEVARRRDRRRCP